MSLSIEEVHHVALLARLDLSAQELEKMQAQLSQILEYIAMLGEVDVSNVPPTAQVTDMLNVLREDAVRPSLSHDDVLANAPDQQEGMFRVRAVFDDDAQ